MKNDPIQDTSPLYAQEKRSIRHGSQSSSPPAVDVVSSPPADRYLTQPTQLIPHVTADILVPATSPFRPVPPPVLNNSYSQASIFTRIAPPGTYPNLSMFRPSQATQPPVINIDSDGEGQEFSISDSENDINDDPSNIKPATVIKSPVSFPSPLKKSLIGSNESHFTLLDAQNQGKARRMQEVFPTVPLEKIYKILRSNRYHEDDALSALAEEQTDSPQRLHCIGSEDDENLLTPIISKISARAKQPKLQNKHTVDSKTSLAQKYNRFQQVKHLEPDHSQLVPNFEHFKFTQSSQESPPKPKRRRLIRGSEISGSRPESPDLAAAKTATIQPQRKKIVLQKNISESDTNSDSNVSSSDDGAKVDRQTLLKFLNTCDCAQLVDLANTSPDVADLIISKRPFRTLKQIQEIQAVEPEGTKRKRGRARAIGERLLEVAEQVWEGFAAMDRLVSKCNDLGTSIQKGMAELNLSTNGTEIAATELDSNGVDSGIGSPTPSQSSSSSFRLEQPKIMAIDFKLKDYQVVALNWLNLMHSNGISPILADEMGLGKTACVIAFISHLYESGNKGPHLIVVPGSTLENWMREFKRFSPSIDVYAYHGAQNERVHMRDEILANPPSVIVTTYDMAQSKEDNKCFRSIQPKSVIFDEGHMLKNKNSKRYEEMMKIKTPWRLLLTGTPLQNNLQELISILGFIMPTLFKEIEDHVKYLFKHRAKTTDEEHTALLSTQRIVRCRNMMAPFILRRKKTQVLKWMPKKTTRIEFCDMTARQKLVYDDYTQIHEDAIRDHKQGKPTVQRNYLMERRKAAIHPLLFRYLYDNKYLNKIHPKIPKTGKYKGWSALKMEEEISWWSDFKIHQTCQEYSSTEKYALNDNEWMDSGKVEKLIQLLHEFIQEGSKTLLFSQFTQVLDILESVLDTEDIRFCRLDGNTSIALRQQYIDDFHKDDSLKVFMLSTKSGGTGINLACANKVIIFDSSFNPHDDIQAENRAHRVGQTKDVDVVRLVTRGTIEEQIQRLGQSKLVLDDMVSGGDSKTDNVEDEGMEMVEKMLLGGSSGYASDDEGKGVNEKEDIGRAFMKGLKDQGLNMKE